MELDQQRQANIELVMIQHQLQASLRIAESQVQAAGGDSLHARDVNEHLRRENQSWKEEYYAMKIEAVGRQGSYTRAALAPFLQPMLAR